MNTGLDTALIRVMPPSVKQKTNMLMVFSVTTPMCLSYQPEQKINRQVQQLHILIVAL